MWHDRRGGGPHLLLVHGFPLDHRIWDGQFQELSRTASVHRVDLPGFGRSRSDAPFTIESLADDLHALMADLGVLPCVLCGLSMGGYISLAFAKKYAADLSGLILVDTRADADTPAAKEGREKMIALARSGGSAAIADAMLPRLIAADASPEVIAKVTSIMLACPALTIEHGLAALRDRADWTALLPQLQIPVEVIVGEKDAISPVSVAEEMVARLPHGHLTVISGAGHLSPMERPAEVAAAIVAAMGR